MDLAEELLFELSRLKIEDYHHTEIRTIKSLKAINAALQKQREACADAYKEDAGHYMIDQTYSKILNAEVK